MFELYKKRDLNAYISDTFTFFKHEGKNFFKNYLILNGGLLLLILVCFYFLGKGFFQNLFQDNITIDTYFENNFALMMTLVSLLFVLSVVFSVIAYTFPVVYLQKMAQNKEKIASSILENIKTQFGRILIFILGTTFIVLPIILVVLFISTLLIFILIGIPLLLIGFAFFASLLNIAYYEYITNQTSFFTAYGKAFDLIRGNFWPIIGSTVVIYMVIQMVTGIISFIPQVYLYVQMFTSTNNIEESEAFLIITLISTILSMMLSFFLNNLMLVNQGLIYYSEIEKKENITSHSIIEEIGKTDA